MPATALAIAAPAYTPACSNRRAPIAASGTYSTPIRARLSSIDGSDRERAFRQAFATISRP